MKRLIICLAVAACEVGQAKAELLVNGGAEDGPLSLGWSTDTIDIMRVQSQAQTHPTVLPYEDDWFWTFAKPTATEASMWQTGSSGLDAHVLRLSGGVFTEVFPDIANDYGRATLSFIDNGSSEISSQSTVDLLGEDWNIFTLRLAVPDNAASWKVTLDGFRQCGVKINVFYDSIALDIISIPGDANCDGIVNVSDLGILATNYGTESDAEWGDGDFDNDGKADVSDLGILATHYGETAPVASVPEPSTLCGLLGLCLAGVLALVRRKR